MAKLGFRYSNMNVETTETESGLVETKNEENVLLMTPSHAGLVETINSCANFLVSSEFSKLNENTKGIYINKLIDSVALNTELTVKTMMLR